jgi:hypothetical protein
VTASRVNARDRRVFLRHQHVEGYVAGLLVDVVRQQRRDPGSPVT